MVLGWYNGFASGQFTWYNCIFYVHWKFVPSAVRSWLTELDSDHDRIRLAASTKLSKYALELADVDLFDEVKGNDKFLANVYFTVTREFNRRLRILQGDFLKAVMNHDYVQVSSLNKEMESGVYGTKRDYTECGVRKFWVDMDREFQRYYREAVHNAKADEVIQA